MTEYLCACPVKENRVDPYDISKGKMKVKQIVLRKF